MRPSLLGRYRIGVTIAVADTAGLSSVPGPTSSYHSFVSRQPPRRFGGGAPRGSAGIAASAYVGARSVRRTVPMPIFRARRAVAVDGTAASEAILAGKMKICERLRAELGIGSRQSHAAPDLRRGGRR